MPSSSLFSSSFFESLSYSRRGTRKNRATRSLARRSQELGAQLCGRLSQIALEVSSAALGRTATAAADVGAGTHANGSSLVSSSSSAVSAPLSFMVDVHRDLSAHYGSHAVRRGLAKPLGPCVHPVLRKGNLATQRAGVHSPRYMRVWSLRLVRRCWCPRCGVWLSSGGVPKLSKLKARRTTLATIKECRVRRQLRPSRPPIPRRRFMLCCLRCLDAAQRAAKRNATLSHIATGGQQQNDIAVRNTAGNASLSTQHAVRKACAAWVEQTATAVLAEARVPRRNRRCRRRSKRRRRDSTEEARAGANATGRADSGSTAAVHQPSTSASQVTQKLALSLTRNTTPLPGVASAGKPTKASAVKVPTTASTAHKSLQGLVPSGPLKKSVPRASVKGPPQPSSKKLAATAPAACKPDAAVTEHAVVASSTLHIRPSLPSPSVIGGAHVRIADQQLEAGQAKHMSIIRKVTSSGGEEPTATASVSGPSPSPTDSLPSSAPPAPPVPSAPARAIPSTSRPTDVAKKTPRPPAKAATVAKKPAAATKKFMDTMNQLGF
ncbi:conserved hypothetical protein [Leishmania mexicana MHOM/GT/2001/U1103]|uniref:Uncharacterized protein n=1 Tax=Leishmania mexicana (strain MHOM/GT/2001/U1103) TaxID=929439 RepID=E9B3S6_LEIMU|nr:conserved hypothetical protein [Leishmania mexicana MHOM/GT/2001/U1103]CBZ29893.1 conserved hypothetical protein [Leishmania mexicana MHOM/GT/2001/U1103]